MHLHIMPRYAERTEVEGLTFEDPGYPGHYAVGAPRHIDSERLSSLAKLLERAYRV